MHLYATHLMTKYSASYETHETHGGAGDPGGPMHHGGSGHHGESGHPGGVTLRIRTVRWEYRLDGRGAVVDDCVEAEVSSIKWQVIVENTGGVMS
jgi:hypothetical protein